MKSQGPVLELLQVRIEKLDDIILDLAASVDVKRQLIATLPVVANAFCCPASKQ
jgi:hypothetical protein